MNTCNLCGGIIQNGVCTQCGAVFNNIPNQQSQQYNNYPQNPNYQNQQQEFYNDQQNHNYQQPLNDSNGYYDEQNSYPTQNYYENEQQYYDNQISNNNIPCNDEYQNYNNEYPQNQYFENADESQTQQKEKIKKDKIPSKITNLFSGIHIQKRTAILMAIIAAFFIFIIISKIAGAGGGDVAEGQINSSPEAAATYFAESLVEQNYDNLLDSLYINDSDNVINLLTADDVKYSVNENGDLKKVISNFTKNATLTTERKSNLEDNQVSVDVTLSENKGSTVNTLNLVAQKDKTGNWYILDEDLYISNWEIEVPHNIGISINNTNIEKNYVKSTDENQYDHYIISYVGKKDVDITMTSTNFGNYQTTSTPVTNDKTTINFFITNNECKQLLSTVQSSYNSYMQTILSKNSENEDIKADDVLPDIQNKFNSSVNQDLLKLYISYLTHTDITSASMSYIESSNGNSTGRLVQDDEVFVSFKYTTTFTKGKDKGLTMNRNGNVTLTYDAETKEYKISNLNDIGLFYIMDPEISDWK